jgi:hypothetical protein
MGLFATGWRNAAIFKIERELEARFRYRPVPNGNLDTGSQRNVRRAANFPSPGGTH